MFRKIGLEVAIDRNQSVSFNSGITMSFSGMNMSKISFNSPASLIVNCSSN